MSATAAGHATSAGPARRKAFLAAALLLSACAVLARCEPAAASDAVPVLRGERRVSDWQHIRQATAWLHYRKPPRRVVYLLGGSGSRESVTGESGWSRELRRRTGQRVDAYVLSSNCQTFVEDARIVQALPRDRGVALISVGFSRFNMSHVPDTVPAGSVRTIPPGAWHQHRYDHRKARPSREKHRLVRDWRADHGADFDARYEGRLQELADLVQLCLRRGIRPVLLEMPLDTVAVRHSLDDVLAKYRQGCRDLAAAQGIRYLDFTGSLRLRASDFFDLFHLLRSGRAKWQHKLSRDLVGKGIVR